MDTPLPTAKELEKLPMRAVVAYAARTARRFCSELRGIIADDIIDDALRQVDAVSTFTDFGKVSSAVITSAGHRVVEALGKAPADMRSLEKLRVVFSIVQATLAAMNLLDAVADPRNAREYMERAAAAAERAVRNAGTLESRVVAADAEAARQDYEILLGKYGAHDDVVIGDPVLCFVGTN